MDTLGLLLGVLLCLAVVQGRSFEDRRDPSTLLDLEDQGPKHHGSESRHRRRRWQMNYGYDYAPPISPYYPERREYDRNQQDLLPRIVKLLEEISVYVKRPQPPQQPQPIYVPYPVPFYVPQYVGCNTPSNTKTPNITGRFPDLEDTNQNWGFVMNENENTGPIRDYARPISFDPIIPLRPLKRPLPEVEHGSQEPNTQQTTQAPKFDNSIGSERVPNTCNAGILACCVGDVQQQRNCFNNFGCAQSYNERTCSPEAINDALEAFKIAYSPVN